MTDCCSIGPMPRMIGRDRGSVRVVRLALLASLAFASQACNLVIDTNRVQCTIDSDCTARGGAFANSVCLDSVCQPNAKWACLSKPATPSTQPAPYQVVIPLRNLVTMQPVANAQVKLCRKLDIDCTMPVNTATSDAAGQVTFALDANFAGYVEIHATGLLPTLYFFNPTVDIDQDIAPISLPSPAANAGLLLQLGRQMIPNHGNVVIQSQDCAGAPAAGVSYSSPDGEADVTVAFYTVGSLPTTTATETGSA